MRARRSGLGSLAANALLLLSVLAAPANAIAAGGGVTFEPPTATSTFPVQTLWRQAFRSPSEPARVELMTRLAGTEAWLVEEVAFGAAGPGAYEVEYTDLGFQLPNSHIEYRFRVTLEGEEPETGPAATLAIVDDRIDWRTVEGDLVRLHWQTGDESFAERALRIAEDSVAETAQLLGVTETEPIDFFVYADAADFQAALGPGTKEFVAGRAIAEIRTLFANVAVSEIGSPWLSIVVPHELAHLVFDTATDNPYHEPPHWMNEGLAVFLSEGYTDSDRRRVANAIDRGTLLPLSSLANGFPSDREELFYLGYAEGTSAIDFFVRTYGQENLVKLIRSYALGVTDDEAFVAATGEGMDAFEAAWLADLDAAQPAARGPQAARPGPTPSSWAGGGSSAGSPGPTAAADANGALPGAPVPDTQGDQSVPVVAAVLMLAALLLIFLGIRGRRRTSGPDEP
ncbi:MAG: peptidase MA family metallohydrolase [Candidatus Limnocylindrales bacterium]